MGLELKTTIVAVVMTFGMVSVLSGQERTRCPEASSNAVVVYGEGVKVTRFSLAELKTIAPADVRAIGHDGKAALYRGVSLSALLERAGGVTGGAVRGSALTQYLVAEAADGYRR